MKPSREGRRGKGGHFNSPCARTDAPLDDDRVNVSALRTTSHSRQKFGGTRGASSTTGSHGIGGGRLGLAAATRSGERLGQEFLIGRWVGHDGGRALAASVTNTEAVQFVMMAPDNSIADVTTPTFRSH